MEGERTFSAVQHKLRFLCARAYEVHTLGLSGLCGLLDSLALLCTVHVDLQGDLSISNQSCQKSR